MRKVIKPILMTSILLNYLSNMQKIFSLVSQGWRFPSRIIANQPKVSSMFDIDASIKAARFIRTCDAFNLPLVTFEDVPDSYLGCLRMGGIIRHEQNFSVICRATVPKLTIVTRKAYGGAYLMSCKHLRSDLNVMLDYRRISCNGC